MEENISLDSKIIELVQQFTNIWDKKHPSHKDALAVANSWKTISQIVGLPVHDCIGRWKNIRQRFAKERRMEKNVPSGSAPYFVLWPLYGLCHFLNDVVVPRRTKSNLVPKQKTNEEENEESSSCGNEETKEPQQTQAKKPKTTFTMETPTPEIWDPMKDMVFNSGSLDFNRSSQMDETFDATSDSQTSCQAGPSQVVRTEKNKIKVIKKKSAGQDVAKLVETCNMMSQNINCFLEQASLKQEKPSEFSDSLWHFLLSLGHLLNGIPEKKKVIMLQSKILEFVGEECDSSI